MDISRYVPRDAKDPYVHTIIFRVSEGKMENTIQAKLSRIRWLIYYSYIGRYVPRNLWITVCVS